MFCEKRTRKHIADLRVFLFKCPNYFYNRNFKGKNSGLNILLSIKQACLRVFYTQISTKFFLPLLPNKIWKNDIKRNLKFILLST